MLHLLLELLCVCLTLTLGPIQQIEKQLTCGGKTLMLVKIMLAYLARMADVMSTIYEQQHDGDE
jgi:hypothetical protein